jgi:hypothetical protein
VHQRLQFLLRGQTSLDEDAAMISSREILNRAGWLKTLILLVAVTFVGVVSGLLVFQPLMALMVLAAIALTVTLAFSSRLARYFLLSLGLILAGYAFFGRGFAYLGVPPVFIGEVVFALAALALLVNVRRWNVGLVEALLLLFMFLGVLATVPYLHIHGVDALRDAVIWAYGVIALAVAWLIRRENLEVLSRWYGALLVPFVLWVPFILGMQAILGVDFLEYPWSGVPIIDVKPGDSAVHLAGVAAFLLTGLWVKRSHLSVIAESILWAVWFIGFLLASSWNRGGLVAASFAMVVLFIVRPNLRMIVPIFTVSLLVVVFILADPTIYVRGDREVSVDQVTTNLRSIVGDTERDSLEGTREWRIDWWRRIFDYTVHGEHFWTGKGFGVNLRVDDFPELARDSSLRSPHSSHMTILARMGVPGILVWSLLQVAFGFAMFLAVYRSFGGNDHRLTAGLIVIFVYWIAMVLNSSFDVYLEGPQGGIWFWAVFGLGLAAMKFQQAQQRNHNGHNGESAALNSSAFLRRQL